MLDQLYKLSVNFKDDFLNFIPQLINALIVLIIGYFLARIIKFLIIKLLAMLGNLLNRRFKSIDLSQSARFIGTTFFWLILLSAFLLITDILGLSVLSKWMEGILKYSPNGLAAILIIFAAVIFGKFTAETITSGGKTIGLDYGSTLGRVAQYLILLTAIIIAIDQIGFEITFLINILDIFFAGLLFATALAFGLGAKTSVSNILAAFYVRKIYSEGDYIRLGDIEGRIIKIDAALVIIDSGTERYSIPAKSFNEQVSSLIKKK